jgi:hypothetical protein
MKPRIAEGERPKPKRTIISLMPTWLVYESSFIFLRNRSRRELRTLAINNPKTINIRAAAKAGKWVTNLAHTCKMGFIKRSAISLNIIPPDFY